jgi:hypothetical protein
MWCCASATRVFAHGGHAGTHKPDDGERSQPGWHGGFNGEKGAQATSNAGIGSLFRKPQKIASMGFSLGSPSMTAWGETMAAAKPKTSKARNANGTPPESRATIIEKVGKAGPYGGLALVTLALEAALLVASFNQFERI